MKVQRRIWLNLLTTCYQTTRGAKEKHVHCIEGRISAMQALQDTSCSQDDLPAMYC